MNQTFEHPNKKSSIPTILLVILISAILIMEAVGGIIYYEAHIKEQTCSEKTEGRIEGWKSRRKRNSISYKPVVKYQAGDFSYTGTSHVAVDSPRMKEGALVTISYNPLNPQDFYIEGYELVEIRAFGSIFVIMGAFAAIIPILCGIVLKTSLDEKKKIRILEIIMAGGVLFVFYWTVIMISGTVMAIFITLLIGPFIFYVKFKNRRNKKQDE